ncbi:hypothetical protein Q8A73_007410 [Channa argus]|nr:hypothetical protein Q8A73_007410 [Channa argus]
MSVFSETTPEALLPFTVNSSLQPHSLTLHHEEGGGVQSDGGSGRKVTGQHKCSDYGMMATSNRPALPLSMKLVGGGRWFVLSDPPLEQCDDLRTTQCLSA